MSLPRWLGRVNKRVFNPREVRKNRYPVLIHIGRRTGRVHQTPLDAFETDTGYVCVVRYGPQSDWVSNTLAAAEARLRVSGQEIDLTLPRLVSGEEAMERFEPPAKFKGSQLYLMFDRANATDLEPSVEERISG